MAENICQFCIDCTTSFAGDSHHLQLVLLIWEIHSRWPRIMFYNYIETAEGFIEQNEINHARIDRPTTAGCCRLLNDALVHIT